MTLTTEWLKERLKNPRSGTEFELINEVLANREAQPVGYITPDDVEHLKSGDIAVVVPNNSYCKIPLFTAPPAPAVPPKVTPEDIPQEHNINTYSSITWAAAWNACRAAMLAAAPEGRSND
ncbi:hypothetical protein [Serratia ficaria]|uniref:hypothetical protein n=1 Tax=Serratia ficaria TaxID=61651 RepID=UPI00217726BB|nr:hypothetical protein [Serratia ficaria]CAI0762668.1 Uncharacterised protein [Serratia ficaria]CAI1566596.1 Uncharacterised protein [Serratia ficaria]CAI2404471.1 Uncharacterised protein [Serratia ficaria]CAI2430654.1 Uncharacterised protein [Serratia ficaria]